ncbi:serine--tRNA ligase [Catelliglobosispora koreensis]|uniref:serine--tRNA ligase n=1 Tax=Catelliglobosispora koreensis TaxID=129052 RepID=UPI000375DC2D|nr:serine--tRNA ligase [Catelliglobosispora koreensis]
MIDLRLLRENPDLVRASQQTRGESVELVDDLLRADEARRSAVSSFEALRAEQKQLGKLMPKATGEEKTALLAKTKELAEQVKAAEAAVTEAEAVLRQAQLALSNVVEEGAPAGGEDDYIVLREVGTKPKLDSPKDHLALGEGLKAIDMERGAKVSGSRFYFLTGQGALLENAIIQLGVWQAVEAGFTMMVPPVLVKPESMEGTGFLGAHATEVYHLPADDLFLVGTSEVALAAYHRDEILQLDEPRRYVGVSTCFRREAGSYGKDTRGIIRVHQFNKAEMFVFATPEQAHDEHLRLLAWEEELLSKLELAYRVIDVAGGDLGSSAARKYDCEAWLPTQDKYREVTSTSNCTTFQARRLNVRFRDAEGKTQTAATLNGTLATTRMIAAILEQHQQPDGSVRVPKALQPYLGGRDLLEPA